MSSTSYEQPDSRLDLSYPQLLLADDAAGRDPGPNGSSGASRLRIRHAALAGGAVALALAALGLQPEPVAPVLPAAPTAAVAIAPAAPVAEPRLEAAPAPVHAALRPKPAPAQRLVRADPPPARPTPAGPPLVTVATRSVPLVHVEPRADAPAELRLAELTTARARITDAEMATPLRRPAPPPSVMAAQSAAPSPMPRPAPDTAPAPAAAATATPGAARPLPRPAAPAPVRVASLAPVAAVAPAIVPMARPARVAPAPAKPRVAAPAPKAAPQKPRVVVRDAPPRPLPVAARPAPTAPVQVVRPSVQPAQPVRQASAVPTAPQRTTHSAAGAGFATLARHQVRSGADMSLIGVFGGADGRHALVLLPNGSIERVRPGDRIRGVQVAAVGSDSVRLSDGSRETVLRLPE